jgi:hypothetical protein
MIKKRILLVWWYDRIDLISPFIKMQEDIEFTCLFYRFKEQENLNFEMPFKRIYWTDFTSPNQILNLVNPEKVIFFGSGNLLTFGLILASKNKNFPTIFVSHGLQPKNVDFRIKSFENSLKNENQEVGSKRYNVNNSHYQKKKFHTLFFYLLSFNFSKNIKSISDFFKIFFISFCERNEYKRLLKLANTFRVFDKYYLFCRNDFHFFKNQDNIKESKVDYIGPYTLDNLFLDFGNSNEALLQSYNERFAIFIDQSITTFSTRDKNQLISKLSFFLKKSNTKLLIKLHPQDYNNQQYYSDDNIVLIKNNTNISTLINDAVGCYGFYSAMLLPIILHKKTICFDLGIAPDITNEWSHYKMIKLVDSINFDERDVDFEFYDETGKIKDEFIYNCLTYTDGKCTERLHQLLLN